ncbi:MAG: hypothetical protein AB7D06_17845 [Pedobacter sp.]
MREGFFTISAIATAICWLFIYRNRDPWFVKFLIAAIAAIPVFGPIFYAFVLHNVPPVKPIEEQAKMSHRLGICNRRNYDPVSDKEDEKERI